jgi:hypothetical protein
MHVPYNRQQQALCQCKSCNCSNSQSRRLAAEPMACSTIHINARLILLPFGALPLLRIRA